MAAFSMNEWHKTGKNPIVPVKVPDHDAGLNSKGKLKMATLSLLGHVETDGKGLAELAAAQVKEIVVTREATELPCGVVFTRKASFTGKQVAEMLLIITGEGTDITVGNGAEEEEKEEKTTEQIAKEEEARILAEMEAEEANNRLSGSNTELPAVPGKPSV